MKPFLIDRNMWQESPFANTDRMFQFFDEHRKRNLHSYEKAASLQKHTKLPDK